VVSIVAYKVQDENDARHPCPWNLRFLRVAFPSPLACGRGPMASRMASARSLASISRFDFSLRFLASISRFDFSLRFLASISRCAM
jgi:hypothetical protein